MLESLTHVPLFLLELVNDIEGDVSISRIHTVLRSLGQELLPLYQVPGLFLLEANLGFLFLESLRDSGNLSLESRLHTRWTSFDVMRRVITAARDWLASFPVHLMFPLSHVRRFC